MIDATGSSCRATEPRPASPLGYREFAPGPALDASVECFWTGIADSGTRTVHHRVFPDGAMDLLFDFRATDGRRASVIGAMTRALTYTTTGAVDLLGVRFRPGGLARFLRLEAAEITDGRASLAEFWDRLADELWERLAGSAPGERVRSLREKLAAREAARPDPFVGHCVARIEAARGSLRIAALESSTGLSARQLERKFARHVGLSPKTFARVVRFKAAVAAAEAAAQPPDWAGLACDFGYADQAHLAREFKEFTGLAPGALLEESAAEAADVAFLQDA